MKKILAVIAFALVSVQLTGQMETFDITTCTPPKDWKKDTKQTAVAYSNVNMSTGSFCVLLIYNAVISTGDAQKDFKNEWNELVLTRYKTEANPKTETQTTADGWKVVAGASSFTEDSINAFLILTVFSGFGKTVSVLTNLNDQTYLSQVDSLLESIKLDKNAVISKQASPEVSQPSVAANDLSITGVWSDYSASIGDYVNSTGAFLRSADVSEMHQYEFIADKTFSYKYLGSMANTMLYIETSGTYSIQAGNLTLNIKMYKSRLGMNGNLKEDKTREIPEKYTFYIGPNKWDKGPFLNMHKEGNYYPWSDYPYDYYKKLNPGPAKKSTTPAQLR